MEYEDLRSFCDARHRYVLDLLNQIKSLKQQLKDRRERNEYLSYKLDSITKEKDQKILDIEGLEGQLKK